MLKVTKHTFWCVTLLKDLITLLGVALLEVLKQFNRIATLLEDLKTAIKPTLLRDLVHYYNGLESNNELT